MAQLPLILAIPRFKENEERVDKLVNGTALETWQTSGGVILPTFAKFLADKDAEINIGLHKTIRVDVVSEFTEAEKEQARDNMGLGSAAVEAASYLLNRANHTGEDGRSFFLTIATAQAWHPNVAPEVINIVFYNSNYVEGSGAYYKKQTSLPTTVGGWFTLTLVDGTDVYYVISEDKVSIAQFGARPGTYGTDNTVANANTVAFTNAVEFVCAQPSRESLVWIPAGTWEIMDWVSPENEPYITIQGVGWNNSVLLAKNRTSGTDALWFRSIEGSFLNCHLLQYYQDGVDPSIIPGRVGIRGQRVPHPELPVEQRNHIDVDITIMGSKISRFAKAHVFAGRGARVSNCLISAVDIGISIEIPDPAGYQFGTGNQNEEAGYRGFHFHNIRCHSHTDAVIVNEGTWANKLASLTATDIYPDIGRAIFRGVGIDGKVTGVATETTTEAIILNHGSENFEVDIQASGNVEAERTPVNLVLMHGDVKNIKFKGRYGRSEQHAIKHSGTLDGSTGVGTATGVVFDGCYFDDPAIEGGAYVPICFIGPNHTGIVLDVGVEADAPLTGIVRTDNASAFVPVANAYLFGGAVGTPWVVGTGHRYQPEAFAEMFKLYSDGVLRGTWEESGSGSSRLWLNKGSDVWFGIGAGTPEGAETAGRGSIYVDISAGARAYVKTTSGGNTGWLPLLESREGTATYDPPSLIDGAGISTTVTVTGAALGDVALASFSLSTQGITVTANVTAANTVTVRFQNETGGTIDLGSGTVKAITLR